MKSYQYVLLLICCVLLGDMWNLPLITKSTSESHKFYHVTIDEIDGHQIAHGWMSQSEILTHPFPHHIVIDDNKLGMVTKIPVITITKTIRHRTYFINHSPRFDKTIAHIQN